MDKIDGLASMVTMGLGRWISFDIWIQSYAMIRKIYDKDADTIIGNCGNQVYILTNDNHTAEDFSKLLGNRTIVDVQRTGGKLSLRKTFLESSSEKPLMNPNRLMRLQDGECIIKPVIKRRDQKGKKVIPRPIFNCEAEGTAFKFRYEYLQDDFPNPYEINFSDINDRSCRDIELKDIVWDYQLTFRQFMERERNAIGQVRVASVASWDVVHKALMKRLGEDYETEYGISGTMTVPRFVDAVNRLYLKKEEKAAFISVVMGSKSIKI